MSYPRSEAFIRFVDYLTRFIRQPALHTRLFWPRINITSKLREYPLLLTIFQGASQARIRGLSLHGFVEGHNEKFIERILQQSR